MAYDYTKHEVGNKKDTIAMTLAENEVWVTWLHENCYLFREELTFGGEGKEFVGVTVLRKGVVKQVFGYWGKHTHPPGRENPADRAGSLLKLSKLGYARFYSLQSVLLVVKMF